MPILVAVLLVSYGMVRTWFGPAVFEFVLDKALCCMLLFAATLMEAFSGLHLMPGVRCCGKQKKIPLLEPRALACVWWAIRLFAFQVSSLYLRNICASRSPSIPTLPPCILLFIVCARQMGHVIHHCAARGVGIGIAFSVVVRQYFLVIVFMSVITHALPRLVDVRAASVKLVSL